MYLSKIRIKNYKSFRDSGEIEFKPGINIIVGQNNAGKTALLEAISLKFQSKPHKSLNESSRNKLWQSPEEKKANAPSASRIHAVVTVPSEEMLRLENEPLWFPSIIIKIGNIQKPADIEDYRKCLKNPLEISFGHDGLNVFSNSVIDNFANKEVLENFVYIERTVFQSLIIKRDEIEFGETSDTLPTLFNYKCSRTFSENIYKFNAERPNLGGSLVGYGKILKPDASNLAEVLQNIQNDNPDIFEEFNSYVSQVFPSVKYATSVKVENSPTPHSGNWNEIRIWSADKKTRRNDLAFPLSECGTGIGQVLSILYVVIASETPRTIIIDEPNSFLHPGAAKKLIQILNQFPQHQYFISTHSPEILSASKPSTITRLKYVDGETTAESINLAQTKELRETLDEIGVKFSDVFFSENILWVEGETEEKTFPLILESTGKLLDVAVLPLVHTDDLKERKSRGRKHAKLVYEIYERLSGANALTPPFVAIILDKENATADEINDLRKTLGDKLRFIPQKMYENYLIDAEAIEEILNNEMLEDADKTSHRTIQDWIEKKRTERFLSNNKTSADVLEFDEWIKTVHAANLLEKLFSEISNQTVEYRKTTHSVKLTEWLLKHKPEKLSELRDFLIDLISGA